MALPEARRERVLAVLALVLGLLLLVRVFAPLHPYVSTTIPVLYLAIGATLVLLVELLVKAARKSGASRSPSSRRWSAARRR